MVSTFSRLIDLHNFDLIYRSITKKAQEEVNEYLNAYRHFIVTHSLICPSNHKYIHSLIHSLTLFHTYSLIHLLLPLSLPFTFTHSHLPLLRLSPLPHSLPHPLSFTPPPSLTHPLPLSLPCSLPHPLSFTHSGGHTTRLAQHLQSPQTILQLLPSFDLLGQSYSTSDINRNGKSRGRRTVKR